MENKKKTKGFVETPEIIVGLMHKRLGLQPQSKLGDFTAGKGKLFGNHNISNCYGIELDIENYNHLKTKFPNCVLGDFFEKVDKVETVDALVLNPPYIKQSNEMIYKSLEKLKDGGRFAIISKKSSLQKLDKEFETSNINISFAMKFGTNLFKPFASVETLLLFGKKGEKQKEFIIQDFSNDEIKVNTRAKNISVKILPPKKEIKGNYNFWEELNKSEIIDTRPTYEDFKNTIINYIARDTGFPKEFLQNPKKLREAFEKLRNYK